ncbi:hypothetical protein BOTNAR_0031g00020 [Botryotinia narcissicola]|uniref:Uncharacterized protein n=1 Tax=Botryotinia narcissicola TaxID=278944 RepID=A0A4Z1JGD5_9HELO|nr:hypothetical protein BOTNAR_0031g00020 [Botryotinia narcissicola]
MPSSTSNSPSARLGVLGGLFLLFSSVTSSNLTYYSPQPGVDPAFANWITEFYTAAEASNTTAYGYSEFFSTNATISLGGWDPSQDVTDGLTVRIININLNTTQQTSSQPKTLPIQCLIFLVSPKGTIRMELASLTVTRPGLLCRLLKVVQI